MSTNKSIVLVKVHQKLSELGSLLHELNPNQDDPDGRFATDWSFIDLCEAVVSDYGPCPNLNPSNSTELELPPP